MKLAVKMSENLHYLITLKPTMSFNKRKTSQSQKLPADDGQQKPTTCWTKANIINYEIPKLD